MQTAILRLFNGIQCDLANSEEKTNARFLPRMVRNGYILDSKIPCTSALLNLIESVVGISGEKANASFHKSWSVVRDNGLGVLAVQQIVHYISTYGYQRLGIYSDDTIYIPAERLDLPGIDGNIPLVVIHPLTSDEILSKIVELGSGVALAKSTIDDIMTIVRGNQYKPTFVEKIKNRELTIALYAWYGMAPKDPVEYLRYVIYRLTEQALLIKNRYLIDAIKASSGKVLDGLLVAAPDNLASIFFRYKPLFLALKSISANKTFFNRLRRKADTQHKPLTEDYLNSVTARIQSDTLDFDTFLDKLGKASVFRKVRLANALSYRLYGATSIVYRVRNGKGWASDFLWQGKEKLTSRCLTLVKHSIAHDMRENVNGNTFYIPSYMGYAIPSSEKQMIGNFPLNSYVQVDNDMIVGIHWTNTDRVIDLDLSVMIGSSKIGWDTRYRSKERDILFSGDLTSAPLPLGASELFYIKDCNQSPMMLFANFYNFVQGAECPCKIFVAQDKVPTVNHYMVDVSKILASATINVTRRQNLLGLIAKNRVYFSNVSIGRSITASHNEQAVQSREYLCTQMQSALELEEIMLLAGAHIRREMTRGDCVDLSPEALDKTTILGLLA